MKLANATNLHRKSGVAQWRGLRFLPAKQRLSKSWLTSTPAPKCLTPSEVLENTYAFDWRFLSTSDTVQYKDRKPYWLRLPALVQRKLSTIMLFDGSPWYLAKSAMSGLL
jgi:hypothetical protein